MVTVVERYGSIYVHLVLFATTDCQHLRPQKMNRIHISKGEPTVQLQG